MNINCVFNDILLLICGAYRSFILCIICRFGNVILVILTLENQVVAVLILRLLAVSINYVFNDILLLICVDYGGFVLCYFRRFGNVGFVILILENQSVAVLILHLLAVNIKYIFNGCLLLINSIYGSFILSYFR